MKLIPSCSFCLMLVLGFTTIGACDASADVITTLFASNNGGSLGGAVYFDIDVLHPAGATIQSLTTNTSQSGFSSSIDIYTRTGTSVGFQTTSTGWTLVSSGTGVLQGQDIPSAFDVADFNLPSGLNGVALVAASDWGHRYTNGNGSNENYSDSNISLSLGSASNVPFSGSPFSPRIWNGSLTYAVPEPSSLIVGGIGLAGVWCRRRRRRLDR